jgi:DNA-3-methyladenine glycosylase II
VLPVDDLGLRIAAGRIYGLSRMPAPAALERLGERWRPFRSMASWYLWQSRRLPAA